MPTVQPTRTVPEGIADRHRWIAARFTARVRGTSDWDAPSPVAGWTARGVVAHLTGWFPPFLAAGTGIDLARGPDAAADPVACWQVHVDAVQDLLEDPACAMQQFTNPHTGELPLDRAVDNFYTADVFMHT